MFEVYGFDHLDLLVLKVPKLLWNFIVNFFLFQLYELISKEKKRSF